MDVFRKSLAREKLALITLIIFSLLSIWWLIIFISGSTDDFSNHAFGFVYGGISIWGGLLGLWISQKWGGLKSYMGKAIFFLGLGLLAQAFGQFSFWYLNTILKIEIPYPGIPDIGFFGTIPFYIYAAYLLAKSSGTKLSIKTFLTSLHAFIVLAVMLGIAYFLFLRDYPFDLSVPLETLLNYGYPTGQAIYISIAILTYSLSRKILGGVMRFPIILLIIAFSVQFLSDYAYVYFHALYFPGSFIDYFYLVAYFVMTLGLIQLKVVADNLGNN